MGRRGEGKDGWRVDARRRMDAVAAGCSTAEGMQQYYVRWRLRRYICTQNKSKYMIPVKTAICSFGMSGRVFHAPFLHVNPGFELYSVWEREKNLAAAIYSSIRTCRTLEELLADEAV